MCSYQHNINTFYQIVNLFLRQGKIFNNKVKKKEKLDFIIYYPFLTI